MRSRHYSNDPFPTEVRNSTGNSSSWKLWKLCGFRLRGSMIEAIVLVESKLSCCTYHKIHSGWGKGLTAYFIFYCQLCIYAQYNLLHSVYFKVLKNHTNCTLHAQSADFKGSWLSQIKINLHQNTQKHFFLLRAISMLNFNSLLDFFLFFEREGKVAKNSHNSKSGFLHFFHMPNSWTALIQTKFHLLGRDQAKKISLRKVKAQLN